MLNPKQGRRTWWAVYWPPENRKKKGKLGIWKAFREEHELILFKTKRDAKEIAAEYRIPAEVRKITIVVDGE